MPSLIGKDGATAAEILKSSGITTDYIDWQSTNGKSVLLITNWTVIRQSPAAGKMVDNKSANITLLVMK